jgi:cytochrome b involved in lipid metabolism
MAPVVTNADSVSITMAEVAKHNTRTDCWTVYKERVYDVSHYASAHPGGMKIFAGKGKDCTEDYDRYHAWIDCDRTIGKYQVGVLAREKGNKGPSLDMDDDFDFGEMLQVPGRRN